METHFLHVRKTGGSAVHTALEPISAEYNIKLWGHQKYLPDVPSGDKIIFGIRHPVTRFASGFNSRLRKGQPKNSSEWTENERFAFAHFGTPDDLARSLSSADGSHKAMAQKAMGCINHVRHRYADWFVSPAYLESREQDILMILHQPDLNDDFNVLKARISLPESTTLPVDPILAHRNPDGFSSYLSPAAIANLSEWYAADIDLYQACMRIRSRIL